MTVDDLADLKAGMRVALPVDIKNSAELVHQELLVLCEQIVDVVVMIIEGVAVDVGLGTKLGNRDVRQLFCLDELVQSA